MKKVVLLLFSFPLIVLGQTADKPIVIEHYVGGIKTMENRRELIVSGSPYRNDAYTMGIVVTRHRGRDSVMMRYNAYYDSFELLKGAQTPLNLVKNKENQVVLNGVSYQYEDYFELGKTKSGYLNPLNEGNTVLFKRTLKTIDVHFPENGYEKLEAPTFKDITHYFLKREGKVAQKLSGLSRKEVFSVLWDKYSELRRYTKKNKLHLRTEEEVIQVLQHYDNLRSAEIDLQEE